MRGKCWHQALGTAGPLVLSATRSQGRLAGHIGRDTVGQEETDRMGEGKGVGEGIVGQLHTRWCGFVLPGDPCCAGQACRGQITMPKDE